MILFSTLFCFFISTLNAQSLQTTAVQSLQNGRIVGSSMQIRTATNSQSPYQFLTAAHVVESNPRIAIAGMEMKTVLLDSAADFAILEPLSNRINFWTFANVPVDLGSSIFGPFRYFQDLREKAITVPSTFHLAENLRQRHSILLRVDGFDPRSHELSQRFFRTPLIQSNISGIPERDQQGALLQFEGDLVPGSSGSAVMTFVDELGRIYDGPTDPCPPRELNCEWKPRLLGMVTTIVPRSRSVSLVPIWTLIERIENPMIQSPRLTKNFRNPTRGQSSGIQRGGDGGRQNSLSMNQWSSGLMILDDPTKRWLDLNDLWTEHEPFDELRWERQGSPRIGFYEERGNLFRSGSEAPWPVWFSRLLPMTPSTSRLGQCHMMTAQKWKTRDDGSPSEINERLQMRICITETANEQKLQIDEIRRRSTVRTMELTLKEAGSNSIEVLATDGRRNLLIREGLRTYENQTLRLEIDHSSGLNIWFKELNQKIIGPIWQ